MRKMTSVAMGMLTLAIVVIVAPRAEAATNYVTVTGNGAGDAWATATSLTNALVISRSNDVIWLEQGTYTNTATFRVASNNVSLYGGFTNGMATLAERNWTSYPTILSGNSNNWRVVTVTATNVTLDGLVITNSYGASAGGITKTSGGALTLANCSIVNHAVKNSGAGCSFTAGTVLMTNCVVDRNAWPPDATYYGGKYGVGINAANVTLDIVDSVIQNQSGDNNNSRGGSGGGLAFDNGTLRVLRSQFINNAGPNNGGGGSGVYLGGNATTAAFFSNCVFRGNCNYDYSASYGAAVWANLNAARTAAFVNCTFVYNVNSNGNGGAIYLSNGTLDLRNCILWSNNVTKAGYLGKEIAMAAGTLRARYSALTGTQLPQVYVIGGSATFSNCMTNNPLFASATDLHVQSPAGRWQDGSYVTTDTAYSPCIDAGDPSDAVGAEPAQNGARVNVGAYAGTDQASKSPSAAPLVANRSVLTNNYTQMILRGELTNDAAVIATVGICYGTNSVVGEMTNGWQYVAQISPPQQTGTIFAVTTSFLLTNTTYYYRTYATNGYGGNWAPTESFTTVPDYPAGWGVGGGANVIHVKLGAVGEADGRDWFNAYSTLGAGIAAISGARSNIWITGSSYGEAAVLTIGVAASVYGGFQGTETAVSQRALTNALGVVTNYTAINGENVHKCLAITANADVWLDTLSISNSPSERSIEKSSGTGKLTMSNCRIENNRGPGDYSYQITGGGVGGYFSSGSVLMTNCVVFGNRCDGYQKYGTGISGQSMILDIVDCLFLSNTNKDMGTARGSRGGGLAFHSGTCRVVRTEFINNQAAANNIGGGGAIFIGGGATMVAVVSNCLFRGNYIGVDGSKAGYGGALNVNLAAGKTVDVVNCTFAANSNQTTASGIGGAVYLAAGTLNLKNCILWTNRVATGSSGHEVGVAASHTLNVNYSDITGTTSPHVDGSANFANCLSQDPLFASATDLHLQSPAGRWDPVTKAWLTSDTTYSPCIDKGDTNDSIRDEPTDNGNIRINLGYYGGTAQASKSPPAAPPFLEDGGYTVVYDRARISGELTNESLTSANVYLCYGTNGVVGDTTNGWGAVLSLGEKSSGAPFTQWTPTLLPTATYYYRLYATNDDGVSWTPENNFLTAQAAPGGGGTVIHVNKDATGAADGTTWPHAYTTIGSGIAAISGSRSNIWITGVTYGEGLRVSLAVSANLYGGFLGTETTVGQRPANAQAMVTNYTVINGEGSHGGLNITAGNVLLDAFAITNCGGGGAGTYTYPAVSYSGAGTLVANNCRLVKNNSTGAYNCDGLGGYFTGGSVLLTNCVVADNVQNGYNSKGFGIYSLGANLTLVDCVVSNNSGDGFNTRGGAGAGMYFDGGALNVLRTDFLSNTGGVQYSAAGVHVGNGANTMASFTNCAFRGNVDGYADGYGAALCLNLSGASKTVTVVNCTFSDNRNASPSGGTSLGGAIYVTNGTVLVKNSIFWTNAVRDGVSGSEIYVTGAGGKLVASYSDFAGTNAPHVVAAGGAAVQWGSGIITNNPLYASATDLHLKSQAGRWDAGTSSWVLDTEQSPCIDRGDPNDAVGSETQPNGRKINMGAYGGTAQASRSLIMGSIFRFR